jgi:hypothetical protein
MTKLTFEISQQNQSEDFFARLSSISNSIVEIKFVSEENQENSEIHMKIAHITVIGKPGASFSLKIDDQHKITMLSARGELHMTQISELALQFSENYSDEHHQQFHEFSFDYFDE